MKYYSPRPVAYGQVNTTKTKAETSHVIKSAVRIQLQHVGWTLNSYPILQLIIL